MGVKDMDTKLEVKPLSEESLQQFGEIDESDDLYIDPKIEAKIVRKLDTQILPIICIFYFLAALDRSNIGNAGPAGFTEALGMSSAQFSNAVTLFFITYICLELPSTLLLRILKPSRLLSFFVLGWSAVCIGIAFVKSYGALLACRLLLGAFESGFFPSLVVYISLVYKKEEQGLRFAILLSCAALSGAVGGLIAYGFVQVQTSSLEGFRFIFLVEGCITIACLPLLLFLLPDDPVNAKIFNEKEREIMLIREKQRQKYMGNNKFEWKEVIEAFKEPRTYLSMVIQFCGDTVLYSFSTFLPSILKLGLGYGTLKAQYLTIPVYFVSSVSALGFSYVSDKQSFRSPYIFGANVAGIIGYIIMLASSNNAVKYFSTYLISIPLYVGPGLNLAWTSNNFSPYYRRTTAIGCNQTIGNLSGAIAGQVYRSSPYVLGHSFALGCLAVGNICVVLNVWRIKVLNRRKRRIISGEIEDTKPNRSGDQVLEFEYTL